MKALIVNVIYKPETCLCVLWQVQVQRRTWIYNGGETQQVGGFVKEFSNLAFLTVKVRSGLLSFKIYIEALKHFKIKLN